jgi:glucose/arabinose dehydrogenase
MVRPAALAAAAAVCALGACGGSSDDAPARSDRVTEPSRPAPPSAPAQRRSGRLRLVSIGRFDNPLYVTAPPGDRRRIFVVEQGGTIRVVRGGRKLAAPFLDIRSKVVSGGEQGLLSMAFAPDYARSGLFYVDYTDTNGDSRIVEYHRASADRADPGSARQVLFQSQPEANHNGGLVLFGPDRLLYIGFGDGGAEGDPHGPRGNGQSLSTLLGKILRIDPRPSGGRPYRVPSSNPFVGRQGVRPEIYSWGLRNPWRFSFDRRTGDLAIADVGQDQVEEVDFARRGRARGRNYGWRPWEGRRRNANEPAPGAVFPVLQLFHSDGNCSITGGYVVRDRSVPALYGRYVYGDYCAGRLLAATLRAGRATNRRTLPLRQVPELSSFGEDALGRVYVTSLAGGVWRFAQ